MGTIPLLSVASLAMLSNMGSLVYLTNKYGTEVIRRLYARWPVT